MHHRYSRATRALWTACMYVRVCNACMCIRPVWCNRTNRVFVLVSSDTWTNDCRTHIQFLRQLNECNRSWNSNSSAKEAENKSHLIETSPYIPIYTCANGRNDISKIDAFMKIDCNVQFEWLFLFSFSFFFFFSFFLSFDLDVSMYVEYATLWFFGCKSTRNRAYDKIKNTRNAQCRLKNNRNCET